MGTVEGPAAGGPAVTPQLLSGLVLLFINGFGLFVAAAAIVFTRSAKSDEISGCGCVVLVFVFVPLTFNLVYFIASVMKWMLR
jgi:hypothetical protein